jgi:glycerol-3-phosphate O-acyltransferase
MRLGLTGLSNNYGRCIVNFATPVSFREFIHKKQAEATAQKQEIDRSVLYQQMKQELCHTFSDSLIIMVTSLVASSILTNRKGATLHEIVEGTKWTYN